MVKVVSKINVVCPLFLLIELYLIDLYFSPSQIELFEKTEI